MKSLISRSSDEERSAEREGLRRPGEWLPGDPVHDPATCDDCRHFNYCPQHAFSLRVCAKCGKKHTIASQGGVACERQGELICNECLNAIPVSDWPIWPWRPL